MEALNSEPYALSTTTHGQAFIEPLQNISYTTFLVTYYNMPYHNGPGKATEATGSCFKGPGGTRLRLFRGGPTPSHRSEGEGRSGIKKAP